MSDLTEIREEIRWWETNGYSDDPVVNAARRWNGFPSDEDVEAAEKAVAQIDDCTGPGNNGQPCDTCKARARAALLAVKTLSEKDNKSTVANRPSQDS